MNQPNYQGCGSSKSWMTMNEVVHPTCGDFGAHQSLSQFKNVTLSVGAGSECTEFIWQLEAGFSFCGDFRETGTGRDRKKMLQRAASNAYSWWWASHIRTKQSKWLEQNLQDMEEKVKCMLQLIEEDGDSFARRAEMYYRKRPELVNFVEESYKQYRALADRYDHISGELQNANNTIATVFPEQVQFAMDDEDDDGSPRRSTFFTNQNSIPKGLPEPPKLNIPKIQGFPRKDGKAPSTLATKKVQPKKSTSSTSKSTSSSSPRMSTDEALQEIDRLQKRILTLQTEKEFFKSTYESGVAKYWEIEKRINEMQEEVCMLQDEFGVAAVIEDDEARTLMAATALKSCEETLVQLQEKQEQSAEEARVESQRIKDAHEKLQTIKNEFLGDQMNKLDLSDKKESVGSGSGLDNLEQEVSNLRQERLQLESIQEKIRAHFDKSSDTCLTVTELVETIDELVHKVISLETAVSSQTALIKRLRSETDELQENLRNLDEDKPTLIRGSDKLVDKVRKLDEKLSGIQDLNQNVEDQNNNLQTHFTETHCNLKHLSEKLHSVKPDEEIDTPDTPPADPGIFYEAQKQKMPKEQKDMMPYDDVLESRKVRKAEAEEEKSAVQNLDPYSKDNEGADIQSMVSNSAGDAYEKCEDSEHQKNVEKQDMPQTKDNILNVDSKQNGSLDIFSEKPNFVKSDEGVHRYDSLKDNIEKQDPSQTEDHIANADLQGICNLNYISNEPKNPKETKTEVEDETDKVQNPSLHVKNDEDEAPSKVSKTSDDISERCEASRQPNKVDMYKSVQTENNMPNVGSEQKTMEEEPNWQKLFLSGLEDREKVLLGEYTSILRNFKDAKKKLSEIEKQNRENSYGMMVQLRELKRANAIKDEEINSLRQKLSFLQTSFEDNPDTNIVEFKERQQANQQPIINLLDDQTDEAAVTNDKSIANGTMETYPTAEDEEEEIKVILVDEPHVFSITEEKFRRDIDELLEENLEFWLRFSTLFHQIQKFQTSIQDLQSELLKLKENRRQEGNTTTSRSLKSDARPIYKHLREIQTELTVWLEKNALLKEELQYRFSSLCQIQEEISRVSKAGSETEEMEFNSYQAAKFQGEVLNMKQENNKVANELEAGLDHVRGLQYEIDKTLSKLNEDFELSGAKSNHPPHQVRHSGNRSRVPLRSFIFGVKQKKQRPSLFRCINPTLQKQYSDLSAGHPP
ncbi:hypothetical protein NE237_018793 [Protea cynaroides]|uniref:NAB domain-containing protein n=1 Tax=Protea cynaroides TaxID=273540 RepID=A0A9Q0QPH6_9MAGN|nr:hypothetical protein NE237_018793 [Protea cynaroides]